MKVVMTQLLLIQCLLYHGSMHTCGCILLLIVSTQILGRPDVRDDSPHRCITERMKVIYSSYCWEKGMTEDGLQGAFCLCLCADLLQSCSTLRLPWFLCPRNSRREFWSELPPTYSRGSSWPRDRNWLSCIAGRDAVFTIWATREALAFRLEISKVLEDRTTWEILGSVCHASCVLVIWCYDQTAVDGEIACCPACLSVSLFCLWFPG